MLNVNKKLRDQGLLTKEDPSFVSVCQKYDTWKADCAKKRDLPDTCRMPNIGNRCIACTKNGKQCTKPN